MARTIQQQADGYIDQALESELAAVLRRKMTRLAKAQALAWNALSRQEQFAYLATVERLEGQ